MKRSPISSSISPEVQPATPKEIDMKPLNLEDLGPKTPPTTPKKKAAGAGKFANVASPAKSPKKKVKTESGSGGTGSDATASGGQNGTWDAVKRALFMDTIISAGYMAVDLKELANKLGMTPLQIRNQLQPGRNNFRAKAVAHIKGE
ncbi:hypothetical protein IAU59_004217 [Kwoniella sp. CBS 9459]